MEILIKPYISSGLISHLLLRFLFPFHPTSGFSKQSGNGSGGRSSRSSSSSSSESQPWQGFRVPLETPPTNCWEPPRIFILYLQAPMSLTMRPAIKFTLLFPEFRSIFSRPLFSASAVGRQSFSATNQNRNIYEL